MRGDAAVTIRLLLRRVGMAGLAAVIGGLAGLLALGLPWHEVIATVDLLGTTSSRVEARSGALPGAWWGWVSAAGATAAVWLGFGVAFDRPTRWARAGLVVAACLMAAGALAAIVLAPEVAQVLGPETTIADLAGRLPVGVTMDLHVRVSAGPLVTLVAAGMVAVGAAGARDL